MDVKCQNTIGLFGYIITVNEEIHSRQIKWLDIILTQYKLADGAKDLIKDILDDKDEKISYNDCIFSFQQESKETKEFIYKSCFQLAVVDDDSITFSEPDTLEEKILKDIEANIGNLKKPTQRKLREQARKSIDQSLLISGINPFKVDFGTLPGVASADYDVYKSVFNNVFSECRKLSNRLETKSKFTKSPLLRSTLEKFLSEYRKNVISTLSDLEASSSKKELAAHNFSIALMGRTKAGKSTLHYVMCKEGEKFIGKGAQRPTRFNRVFSWRGLKIIDTPGIGAGEEGGKKDEAIALRVLTEADIICFVVIDDTIQSDILELLDKIAEYHKPMLIILNHKEDIRKRSHRKTFDSNPNHWRLTEGESNLAGYINRLNGNAKKHNYDTLMRIVPVFLLATQISGEENNEQMYRDSNFPEFIETIHSLLYCTDDN